MKILRLTLLVVGCILIPFLWLGAVLMFKMTLCEWYVDIWDHYKSGEPFGILDGGCDDFFN